MYDMDIKHGVIYIKPYKSDWRINDGGRMVLLAEEARDLAGALTMATNWPVDQEEEDA